MAFVFSYPGIHAVTEIHGTLAHGVTPSQLHLVIHPQDISLVQQVGTLVFGVDSTVIVMPDCLVDAASVQRNTQGQLVALTLLDRRWRWKIRTISGFYNLRDSRGNMRTTTEQTPQEIATLLLDELGEKEYDITALPNDTRPLIEWQTASAALELQSLCETLGCLITLTNTGRVRIVRHGDGAGLPDGSWQSNDVAYNPVELPDEIEVVSSPIRHQIDLALEAVGATADGEYVPINDLSYKPAAGWSSINLAGGWTELAETERALAEKYVYRYYRIQKPDQVAGLNIDEITQILPIFTFQTETERDGQTQSIVSQPALVWGLFYREDDVTFGNTELDPAPAAWDRSAGNIVPTSFQLVPELGLVIFSEPVFTLNAALDEVEQPTLYLRTSVPIRDLDTREFRRYRYRVPVGESRGTGPQRLLKSELQPWENRTSNTSIFGADNFQAIEREASYYAQEWLRLAVPQGPPSTLVFNGFVPVSLDGITHSIAWHASGNGFTTTVQRYADRGSDTSLSWEERRRLEKDSLARQNAHLLGRPSQVDAIVRNGEFR